MIAVQLPQIPVAASTVAPDQAQNTGAYIAEASQRFGIPPRWIEAVITAESRGNPDARSRKGAVGLMQLMPATWQVLREELQLGSDPASPRDNILAGTAYLRVLYDKYGFAGFLAAYNAGPGRYEAWRDSAKPLPAETRAYVTKLSSILKPGIADYAGPPLPRTPPDWKLSALFPLAESSPETPAHPDIFRPETSPFVSLSSPAPAGRGTPAQSAPRNDDRHLDITKRP